MVEARMSPASPVSSTGPSRPSHRILPLVLLGAVSCGGFEGEPAAAAGVGEEGAVVPVEAEALPAPTPALRFERTALALGTVSDAEDLRVAFAFTNAGTAELAIQEVRTTCGCTTTELARDRYAPGEGAEIEVSYRPQGQGPTRRTIHVFSNDPSGEPVELHLDAVVEPFITFEPRFGVRLGEVDRGVEHRAEARFKCADPEARLLEVTTMHDHLEARVLEREEAWTRIELVLGPDAPWGNLTTSVLVKVEGRTSEEARPVVHVGMLMFNAMLFDQVRVDPGFFSVGMVEPGDAFGAQVQVVHRHGQPFAISGLRIEDATQDSMTVRAEPMTVHERPLDEGRPGQRVIVEGRAGDVEGQLAATVVIETDIEGEPPFRLRLMGRVGQRNRHRH